MRKIKIKHTYTLNAHAKTIYKQKVREKKVKERKVKNKGRKVKIKGTYQKCFGE